MEGRIIIANLNEIDQELKGKAAAYFLSAKEADENTNKYENIKFAAELSFQYKLLSYESMINTLKKTKEKESQYKECVDNANDFLV